MICTCGHTKGEHSSEPDNRCLSYGDLEGSARLTKCRCTQYESLDSLAKAYALDMAMHNGPSIDEPRLVIFGASNLPLLRRIPDIEQARQEWKDIGERLEKLSDEIRQMPRFKGVSPDCQLLADAVATIMSQLKRNLMIDRIRED